MTTAAADWPDRITFSVRYQDDGRRLLHIDHAPVRSHITASLLMEAVEGGVPCLTVGGEQLDVVIVRDDFGQEFVYALGVYDSLFDSFEMERPE